MHKILSDFARQKIKEGLEQCNDAQQLLFKRMYSHTNFGLDINDVVDNIIDDKLDWALTQVYNQVNKNNEQMG